MWEQENKEFRELEKKILEEKKSKTIKEKVEEWSDRLVGDDIDIDYNEVERVRTEMFLWYWKKKPIQK